MRISRHRLSPAVLSSALTVAAPCAPGGGPPPAASDELALLTWTEQVAVTIGDVRRFMYDELWRPGLRNGFQPDLRVRRQGMADVGSRGFLAFPPEATVIEPGDVIHVDFGIS